MDTVVLDDVLDEGFDESAVDPAKKTESRGVNTHTLLEKRRRGGHERDFGPLEVDSCRSERLHVRAGVLPLGLEVDLVLPLGAKRGARGVVSLGLWWKGG